MDAIKTGTILLENGTLPSSLMLSGRPHSADWTTVANLFTDFERDIKRAGWSFFFLAGEIHATVFGFNAETAVHTAVGLPFASVPAHSRHIQGGSVFAG